MSGLTNLRVLVLTMTSPTLVNGIQNSDLEHIRGLAEEFDVTVLAPRPAGQQSPPEFETFALHWFRYAPSRWEQLAAAGGALSRLAGRPSLWLQAVSLSLAMLFHAARLHRDKKFQVVDAVLVFPCGTVAKAINGMFGVPYVVLAQGVDAFVFSGGVLGWLRRATLAGAHRVIGMSREIAEHVAPHAKATAVHPLGVDFGAFTAIREARDPEPGHLLYAGRLIEKKGVNVALEAVSHVPDVRLTIVGDGPARQSLEALARELCVSGRVTFKGHQELFGVFEEFRRAECLLIPSVVAAGGDREGTPRVLGEAVASGVPVICSASHGMLELLEDGVTGTLVPPGDAKALAAAIRGLRADPARAATMAAAARRTLEPVLASRSAAGRYVGWLRDASAGAQPSSLV